MLVVQDVRSLTSLMTSVKVTNSVTQLGKDR